MWKEDSVEFFFKQKQDSDEYYQFLISCSGDYIYHHNRHLDNGKYERVIPWSPENIIIQVNRHKAGYDVKVELLWKSIGFESPPKRGNTFYGQVVRNYRQYKTPQRETLQLFPTHIYCDNTGDPINHHRRSFHTFEIK